MTTPEQNVALAHEHAALFEEVRLHNFEVIRRRRLGGAWDAPENQYRNAWLELEAGK